MTFQPGQSGNPAGKPPGTKNRPRRILAALTRYVDEHPEMLDKFAEAAWKTSIRGDVAAMNLVADRLDGKVPQAIVGDEDHPSVVRLAEWYAWTKSDLKSPGDTGPVDNLPPITIEPNDSQK